MAIFGKADPKPLPPGASAPGAPGGDIPSAASTPEGGPAKPIPGLAIRALPATGFCRAGRRWLPEVQVVAVSEFTKAQIAALREETHLVVEDVDITPEAEPGA